MSAVIYRPHRGGLAESMRLAQVFSSFDEMKEVIAASWASVCGTPPPFDKDDIVINDDSVVNDERTGWEDTKYVCVKRMYDEVYSVPQCIGMCATIFPFSGRDFYKNYGDRI